ncbi:MAG: hypothetical protein H7Z37_10385 [Pyrinomonadaceae bacterium]|nr:hypothetical protein [Pyrinomonadaceae bacterium]
MIVDEGDYEKILFVVKLTPPFVKSEILKDRDLIENKPFTMFSRTLFVNIESLWVVGGKSGRIYKKQTNNNDSNYKVAIVNRFNVK